MACIMQSDIHRAFRYPGLRHVPWVRADVLAGECLYVPVNWFHQVASDEDTFGINFWWTAFDRGAPSNGYRNRGSNNAPDQHLHPSSKNDGHLDGDPAADDPAADDGPTDDDPGGDGGGGGGRLDGDPAADDGPTDDDPGGDGGGGGGGGGSDDSGHSQGGANAYATHAHTLDQVEFSPAEQLRYGKKKQNFHITS